MSRWRRSRTAWPGELSTAGVSPGHIHDLPNPLVQRVRFLTRGFIIVGLSLVSIVVLVMLLILQRGQMRDRENERLREQIRQSTCDLLDQLPEGGLLERPRHKYHCGPGIPVEDLTPQEQAQLKGRNPAAVPVLPPGVESAPNGFVMPGGADADAPRPEPYYPTPGVAEPPATVPYPPGFPPPDPVQPPAPSPLAPVTDLVCDLADVCL